MEDWLVVIRIGYAVHNLKMLFDTDQVCRLWALKHIDKYTHTHTHPLVNRPNTVHIDGKLMAEKVANTRFSLLINEVLFRINNL